MFRLCTKPEFLSLSYLLLNSLFAYLCMNIPIIFKHLQLLMLRQDLYYRLLCSFLKCWIVFSVDVTCKKKSCLWGPISIWKSQLQTYHWFCFAKGLIFLMSFFLMSKLLAASLLICFLPAVFEAINCIILRFLVCKV